ncbi:hypothetical protein [Hyalangium gracile]|uniref:hypothetical protein n=1 Tax=Hyalangium gracile TaxID=394092 RepID=UPI001CCB0456|nr:hypothetical protein [Hyalangium gracile]
MVRSLKAVMVAGVLSTTLSAGATPAGDKFDSTHPGWIFSHGWEAVSGPAYSDALHGTLHLTQTAGAVATFTCENTYVFDFAYSKAANRGKFELFVNGNSWGVYDAYSPTTVRQNFALFGGHYVTPAQNITVTIKALGTKNPASSGTWVDVDYVECY